MREHLIAFIEAAAAKQDGGGNGAEGEPDRRFQFVLGVAGGYGAALHFGYGYFSGENVLYYGPKPADGNQQETTELPIPEGVDRFLKAYDLDR